MELFYDIRPGHEMKVEEVGLSVRFVSVEEDSRCPLGVNCVWGGNVRVALLLSLDETGGGHATLNSALEPRAIRVRGRCITIKKVAPPKIEGETIKPDEYVITLAVDMEESDDASDGATL